LGEYAAGCAASRVKGQYRRSGGGAPPEIESFVLHMQLMFYFLGDIVEIQHLDFTYSTS